MKKSEKNNNNWALAFARGCGQPAGNDNGGRIDALTPFRKWGGAERVNMVNSRVHEFLHIKFLIIIIIIISIIIIILLLLLRLLLYVKV